MVNGLRLVPPIHQAKAIRVQSATYNRRTVSEKELKELLGRAAEQGATHVPIVRSVPADLLTPVSAFLKIAAQEPESFLLESVEGGEHVGRYSYLGARPFMVATAAENGIEIRRGKKRERRSGAWPGLRH